jgi:hypothetical protein
MKVLPAAAIIALAAAVPIVSSPGATAPIPPRAGKVEIMKASDVKPGMQAVAWTVFQGTVPEPVPIEIVGMWKNMWGPGQDIIVGKMGGKAKETNVAGGMSGSPVYVNGKLIGAVALRLSTFSPDAICGITPIELMLEINELDKTRPMDARAPAKSSTSDKAAAMGVPNMVQIDTPLTFSGFSQGTLTGFGPMLHDLGITSVMGGAGSTLRASKPAPGWQQALNPGESVAGVLVSGDMSITGLGTVTYNDGKRVLAFGHPFFNLGPVDMPMSKGEVLMVLSSSYQPNKMANATEIVGSLHQDRHSGIMGVLGLESPMIPVTVKVRSLGEKSELRSEKDFHFNVFQHQKWTPYLMMMTLFNSLSGDNEFKDEATYRLSGTVEMEGHNLLLSTMQSSGEMPLPAPMLLATWYGEKFNRLYLNAVDRPDLKRVDVTVDLLPERRIAAIENAWVGVAEARPGDKIPVKVFLRPYRGDRLERDFTLTLPEGISKGEHRIMLSDADTMNRLQTMAGMVDRYIDVKQAASIINQERTNNRLYVSLLENTPTAYYDDKTMPSLPPSVVNVMQAGRASSRSIVMAPESATEQMSLPFDYVVSGSYALKFVVR